MRRSYTAVIERGQPLAGDFATEPYEAGWASEAIFFVRLLDPGSGVTVEAHVEISPDGMHWIDEGAAIGRFTEQGLAFARTANFGNWLRLAGSVHGAPEVRALVVLALKE